MSPAWWLEAYLLVSASFSLTWVGLIVLFRYI